MDSLGSSIFICSQILIAFHAKTNEYFFKKKNKWIYLMHSVLSIIILYKSKIKVKRTHLIPKRRNYLMNNPLWINHSNFFMCRLSGKNNNNMIERTETVLAHTHNVIIIGWLKPDWHSIIRISAQYGLKAGNCSALNTQKVILIIIDVITNNNYLSEW